MSKLVLGLDLGITSVGYGLVDSESGNIIKAGVRLFDEGTASENEKRRGFRGSRRLKRRKSFRIQRLQHLLKEEKILKYKEFSEEDYKMIGINFSKIASKNNMSVQTCFEDNNLVKYGFIKGEWLSKELAFKLTNKIYKNGMLEKEINANV